MRRLVVVLLGCAAATAAVAATVSNSVVLPQKPGIAVANFSLSDTPPAFKAAYTAGANGARCYGLVASSSSAAAHVVAIRIAHNPGLVLAFNSTLTVPAGAGATAGIPIVPLLGTAVTPGLMVDAYGNQFLQLGAGDVLQAGFLTALTGTENITVYGPCNDY